MTPLTEEISSNPTDEEIICTWMEPKPEAFLAVGSQSHPSMMAWWVSGYRLDEYYWYTRHLTLDALWYVEERLTDEQWYAYVLALTEAGDPFLRASVLRNAIHFTAEHKIHALAAVLRGVR